MTTFQQNYNVHLNELKKERETLKVMQGGRLKMSMSQSLAINTMQIENGIKAFIIRQYEHRKKKRPN